jgi:hypothetical protein
MKFCIRFVSKLDETLFSRSGAKPDVSHCSLRFSRDLDKVTLAGCSVASVAMERILVV